MASGFRIGPVGSLGGVQHDFGHLAAKRPFEWAPGALRKLRYDTSCNLSRVRSDAVAAMRETLGIYLDERVAPIDAGTACRETEQHAPAWCNDDLVAERAHNLTDAYGVAYAPLSHESSVLCGLDGTSRGGAIAGVANALRETSISGRFALAPSKALLRMSDRQIHVFTWDKARAYSDRVRNAAAQRFGAATLPPARIDEYFRLQGCRDPGPGPGCRRDHPPGENRRNALERRTEARALAFELRIADVPRIGERHSPPMPGRIGLVRKHDREPRLIQRQCHCGADVATAQHDCDGRGKDACMAIG